MTLKAGAKCVFMSDAWDELTHYKIMDIDSETVRLRRFDDFIEKGAVREIPRSEADAQIFITPFTLDAAETRSELHTVAMAIANLSSSWIRERSPYLVEELIDQLASDPRLVQVPRHFLEGCLRSQVASNAFEIKFDGRKKEKLYSLILSNDLLERERSRMFAGSVASELDALSERVRHLIAHTGTVGTYRENLLQTLLRKNLPERYHVATGFIQYCPRQLDVLIYDRVDYAPLFREGDLVVVPPESVRAVIEVKTTLNKAALQESLALLDQIAGCDDLNPPFFRGIFGFESPIAAEAIYDTVIEAHTKSPTGLEDLDESIIIAEPYSHFSAVCVLQKAYAEVSYEKNGDAYQPVLIKGESVTGLAPQAAYFIHRLLSYLRFGGLKPSDADHLARMLGADTKWTRLDRLVTDESWGAYFQRDVMGEDDGAIEATERAIRDVARWLSGHPWRTSDAR